MTLTSVQLEIFIFQLGTPEYHNVDTKTTRITRKQLYIFYLWPFWIYANQRGLTHPKRCVLYQDLISTYQRSSVPILVLSCRNEHSGLFLWLRQPTSNGMSSFEGSMFLMIRFQLTRHCTSSPYSPFSDKSFLILSNHFRLIRTSSPPLPRHLNHNNSFAHIGPMYSSSFLNSLVKLHSSIFNTLISATYCDFFTAHVSAAYTIVNYTKQLLLNKYSNTCLIENCYVCRCVET